MGSKKREFILQPLADDADEPDFSKPSARSMYSGIRTIVHNFLPLLLLCAHISRVVARDADVAVLPRTPLFQMCVRARAYFMA